MVDASSHHVGASLQQRPSVDSPWQPLGFYSRKLEPAQTRYSAFDRELWACFSGIRHFRHLLEGRRFTIFTDHKPLTFALRRTSDPWTPRQCRQLSYIAEFTSDLRHVAGADNIVADTLSRPPAAQSGSSVLTIVPASVKAPPGSLAAVVAAGPPLDLAAIAAAQLTDQETRRAASSGSPHLRVVVLGNHRILCDTY